MVPSLSVIFIALSLIISVGLPLALFFLLCKRFGAKPMPVLIGAAFFIIFALVLEPLLHRLVLPRLSPAQHPLLYVLYAVLTAGIFEETARFVAFRLLRKRGGGVETALFYGVGHGGTEAFLLVGLTMLNNLILTAQINSGTLAGHLSPPDPDALAQLQTAAARLIAAPSYLFLLGAAERVLAIGMHIALSVLGYYAVLGGKKTVYVGAVLLHALFNVPAALLQTGVLSSVFLVEFLACAPLCCAIIWSVSLHRQYAKRGSLPLSP